MVFIDDGLVMFQGVELGEVVAADKLGEAHEQSLRIVSQVRILLGQGYGLSSFRGRDEVVQADRSPIGRRLALDAFDDSSEKGVLALFWQSSRNLWVGRLTPAIL